MAKIYRECPDPIFVVGMNGSGTTLFLDLLNNHPSLFGFAAETKILPYYINQADKYGDLSNDASFRSLWDDMSKEYAFAQANKRTPVPLPDNWQEIPRSVAGVFDALIQHFIPEGKQARWCEKTPMYAQHMSSIAEIYPKALFIHLVRDGRDSAFSFYRRWKYNPEISITRWKNVVRHARSQGQKMPERYLELRYEDLLAEPREKMEEVCRFLGLTFDEQMLVSSRSRGHMADMSATIASNNTKRYVGVWSESYLNRLESLAGAALVEFGYQTGASPGDEDLSPLRFRWLRIGDNYRMALHFIQDNRFLGRKNPFRKLYSRFSTAIRQRRTNRY